LELSAVVEIRYKDVFGVDHDTGSQAAFIVGRGFAIAGSQPERVIAEGRERRDLGQPPDYDEEKDA
jgi:hypothetical protein